MESVVCSYCKKRFSKKRSQIKRSLVSYCSAQCQHQARKSGRQISCRLCGKAAYKTVKSLKVSKYKEYFCSLKCSNIAKGKRSLGENHPNWITGEYSYKARLSRETARKRACLLCDIKNPSVLAVHHIDQNRKNNVLENLAWLCHNCHFLVHHYQVEKKRLAGILNK